LGGDPVTESLPPHLSDLLNNAICIALANTSAYNNYMGGIVMAKTTNLFVRIEPEIKEQAEAILAQLGIPVSNAVNIFLKQVIMQRGLPFDVKLPAAKLPSIADMTNEELNVELEKGYADFLKGNYKSAEQTFADIRKDYGI
jgi:DNA-damage-inducible protein J